MSMINDALKRAKDAQKKSPSTAPGPQLRPAELAQFSGRGLSLIVPVLLVFAVLIGVFFLWQALKKPEGNPEPVRAKTVVPEIAGPKATPPVQVAVVSVPKPKPETSKPSPEKAAAPAPVVIPSTPVKLQAIFYAPGHSTAIINGKTVSVGGALKEYRVIAITQTSVKLVSATRTNVMTLVDH